MINHNLKLILRNLWKRRVYSFVILLSLTVAFVCSNLLIAFLVHETRTDSFHAKHERIFQLFSDDPFEAHGRISFVPKAFADYAASHYPEVRNVCQINNLQGAALETDNGIFRDLMILRADSSFFSFFDFPLVQGRRDDCLAPGKIVLSAEKAMVLFGRRDVAGEVVTLRTDDSLALLTVSAVFEKPVENTHLNFDALVPQDILRGKSFGGVSYLLLNENTDIGAFGAKVNGDPMRPSLVGPGKIDYHLSALTASYFNPDNKFPFMRTRSPMFIRIVFVVCGLIMFIAAFNFINLFLLFSQYRRKEIGIKKTLGITPATLLGFSAVEASIYIAFSMLAAFLATAMLLPLFNSGFESRLTAAYFFTPAVLFPVTTVIVLSAASVAGISAWKQWRMKAVNLMARDRARLRFNRELLTFQFVISITLAICSVTIVRQVRYIEHAPLGFNRSIVQVNAPGRKRSELLRALKQRVSQLKDVTNVAISDGNPISANSIVRLELDSGQFYSAYLFSGDEDFLKTMDLQILEGKLPLRERAGNLVNEQLVRQFGIAKPVGEIIPGTKDVIAGVVKDFTIGSFKQAIPPVIISYHEEGRALLIDYSGTDLSTLLPQLQEEWARVFPDNFFDYQVIQADLMKKYKGDILIYKIVVSFSIVSVLLSCIGLFALSWAMVQNRTKEIGIRKVLGATSADVLNLLTWSFMKRIALAFFIAAPIGYYLMDRWLMEFIKRVSLDAWIFVLSALIMMAVSALALSVQTVKAALTNPVDEIRNE